MDDENPTTGGGLRDGKGRFQPGHVPINGGKNNESKAKGKALHDALLAAVTAQDIQAIVKKLISKAKNGNIPAAKEVLDRCIGKVPQAMSFAGAEGGPVEIKIKYVEPEQHK